MDGCLVVFYEGTDTSLQVFSVPIYSTNTLLYNMYLRIISIIPGVCTGRDKDGEVSERKTCSRSSHVLSSPQIRLKNSFVLLRDCRVVGDPSPPRYYTRVSIGLVPGYLDKEIFNPKDIYLECYI